MFRFLKKHKLKIFTAMFCSFALSLFTILSFGCKTYAYTIDSNGNLVGDNLLNIYDKDAETRNGITTSCINQHINVSGLSTSNTNFTIDIEPITIESNVDYTFKFFGTLLPSNQRYVLYFYDNTNYLQTSTGFDGQTSYFTINVNQQMILDDIIIFSLNDVNIVINGYIEIFRGLYSNDSLTSWEPKGIWYSQTNYNEIVNDYNTIEYQYNSLLSNVEIFNDNISSQSLYFNNTLVSFTDWNYVFVAEKRRLTINTSGLRDIYDGIGANTSVRYELKLDNPVSSLSCYGYVGTRYDIIFTIYNSDNNIIFSNSYNSTSGSLADGNFDFGNLVGIKKIIIETTIEDNDYGRDNSFIDFGSDYASGYADGVKENNTYWRGIAEDYDIKINKLNNDINTLNGIVAGNTETINTLKSINADLQESLNNNVGWQSLFFAMADTPIRTVSNVLGFELFGLNLFSTFIGMVTVFAIVWLLKKFI